MAQQQTGAEELYWFAHQLVTNADNLHIPEEIRRRPGAYKLILLATLADVLQQELAKEAETPSLWYTDEEIREYRLKQETQGITPDHPDYRDEPAIIARWHARCRGLEVMMRSVCIVLETVCKDEFSADYIKAKALIGLQFLGLCEDVDIQLTAKERHLQQG